MLPFAVFPTGLERRNNSLIKRKDLLMDIFENVKKNFGFGCMRLPMRDGEVDTEKFSRMRFFVKSGHTGAGGRSSGKHICFPDVFL